MERLNVDTFMGQVKLKCEISHTWFMKLTDCSQDVLRHRPLQSTADSVQAIHSRRSIHYWPAHRSVRQRWVSLPVPDLGRAHICLGVESYVVSTHIEHRIKCNVCHRESARVGHVCLVALWRRVGLRSVDSNRCQAQTTDHEVWTRCNTALLTR